MRNQDNMQNCMMMKDGSCPMMCGQMQMYHTFVYIYDILVIAGLVVIIVLLSKMIKALRKR